MFLNFPVMDMNRNAFWRNPEQVPQEYLVRMTRFWGDRTRKQVAYAESEQGNLFSAPDLIKRGNDVIVAAFRRRLQDFAGFAFVPEPLPVKNKINAVVYYLFPHKLVAKDIIEDIFAGYRP